MPAPTPITEKLDKAKARLDEIAAQIHDLSSKDTLTKADAEASDKLIAEHQIAESEVRLHEKAAGITKQKAKAASDPEVRERMDEFRAWMKEGNFGGEAKQELVISGSNVADYNAAQSTETDNLGGDLTDDVLSSTIIDSLKYAGNMRELCTVYTTADGNGFKIPEADDADQTGAYVAENADAPNQDITFGVKTLNAQKITSKRVLVPNEAFTDWTQSPDFLIPPRLIRRIRRFEDAEFVAGVTSGRIAGALPGSTAGHTAAAAAAISYDDIVNLIYSVDAAYREGAEGLAENDGMGNSMVMGRVGFVLHDETLQALMLLKDGDSRPLWLPSVSGDKPATILGYPYAINNSMEQVATGKRSLLFGNFGYYAIRDVNSLRMVRNASVGYNSDQTGFVAFHRTDGRYIGPATSNKSDAVVHLLHP